jgi:hypothetical protein
MLNFKKFELRLPDSPWRLPDLPSLGVSDSPTCRVGELATPRLAEFSFKHSKAESESRRLPDSASRRVVFGLRISPIRSQNWNGSKDSVRDLWGTNFCKNPRKSASSPCPFKQLLFHTMYFKDIIFHILWLCFFTVQPQDLFTLHHT